MESPVPIRVRIERARHKLHQMQMQYGSFNHPKVLRQSVALDELLNQYNLYYQQDRHTRARLHTNLIGTGQSCNPVPGEYKTVDLIC